MLKSALLLPLAVFAWLSLSACDSATSVTPDEISGSSRHGETGYQTDAASFCSDAELQFRREGPSMSRHEGRNPDCYQYNGGGDLSTPADDPAETPPTTFRPNPDLE